VAPRLVERGLTGIFRSRWGVALILGVLVLAIVGLGRVFGTGNDGRAPVTSRSPATVPSADPDDEDSVISPQPPPTPVTSPGTAKPEAVAYAFAAAWADHGNVSTKAWHDRLVPNSTPELADSLSATDPADVPASRVIGRPELKPVGEGLVDAVVTADTGRLTLRLVAPEGKWLVSDIDWADQ
jgi:hypothetical protein